MRTTEQGSGRVAITADSTRLYLPAAAKHAYHNAQIATYTTRKDFHYTPPLRLSLRAHVEGHIPGTAGFGFWNHPYDPTMRGPLGLRLPRAVWFFFGAPPNDMPLAMDVPGHGWKCATFDAANPRFAALLPLAPIGFLLMRVPALYRRLWPVGQAAIGVSEHLLDPTLLQSPHTYTLDWLPDRVTFTIDGEIVHETGRSPRGPLGFVAWVDNQYAIVTPQGRFGFGVVEVQQPTTLTLSDIRFDDLSVPWLSLFTGT